MQPFIGSVALDRYRIEAELGAGAMGTVYRARHIKVSRTVAIKVLHDHLVCEPQMIERFDREARIAAKLKHPNLVAVIDLGVTPEGKKLMVLEFAPGDSLAQLVIMPFERRRVIALTRQLLLGLEHAHGLGLIHRDLKPENVLVERTMDGEIARIVDFGIAVLRDADDTIEGRRLTTTGIVLGTPMYMSPEQARGERVDARADLFALGVIVYEMLAGRPPFQGSGVEIMMLNMHQDPPSIATRTGRQPDPLLEAFSRKLMARDANDRFASATAALAVLDLIETDRDAAAEALGLASSVPEEIEEAAITKRHVRPASVPPPSSPPRRSAARRLTRLRRAAFDLLGHRRWGTAIGAAAFGIAALVAFVALRARGGEAPAIEVAPSPNELPLEFEGTATLPPPPVDSTFVIEPSPEPPAPVRRAVNVQRVVIAPARVETVPVIEREELLVSETPAQLAEKYVRVGRLLRDRIDLDEQRQRFRLIQLDSAMATPATRRAALDVLGTIEREID